jgi:hypothetical protein
MVGMSQPFLYRVFDFASLVLGLLPSSLAVVTVILIGVESQKGANHDCKNYYDCGSHRNLCSMHDRNELQNKEKHEPLLFSLRATGANSRGVPAAARRSA